MTTQPSLSDLKPGTQVRDTTSGLCTVKGLPRHIAGGYVVDVVGTLWDGTPLPWTACVVNLRWPEVAVDAKC